MGYKAVRPLTVGDGDGDVLTFEPGDELPPGAKDWENIAGLVADNWVEETKDAPRSTTKTATEPKPKTTARKGRQ